MLSCPNATAKDVYSPSTSNHRRTEGALQVDITGSWVNQNGSVLTIESEEHGIVSGEFVSTKGRAARGISYPVIGTRNHNLVSFAVNFQSPDHDLRAITTFSGRLVPGSTPTIHTLWVLAREFEDPKQTKPTHVWNTFLTNSDVFTLEKDLMD